MYVIEVSRNLMVFCVSAEKENSKGGGGGIKKNWKKMEKVPRTEILRKDQRHTVNNGVQAVFQTWLVCVS